jgi:RNA polymerase sigma-70 factor, ECF subfamily
MTEDGERGAPSDTDLMVRVAARDESAFAALYDRHARVVYGSVVRYLGDPSAAEEVVQEAYLAVWQRATTFDPASGTLLGWLFGIARNKSIDRARAAARRPRVADWSRSGAPDDPESQSVLERALGPAGPAGDPEAVATRQWVQAVVRTALAAMAPQERIVLELAYDEGLSQSEVAERLGWPLGTVKSRTRRALAALRDVLAGIPDLAETRGTETTGHAARAMGGREGS